MAPAASTPVLDSRPTRDAAEAIAFANANLVAGHTALPGMRHPGRRKRRARLVDVGFRREAPPRCTYEPGDPGILGAAAGAVVAEPRGEDPFAGSGGCIKQSFGPCG